MNIQEKIDACKKLANDEGATPSERDTARRFAEKLEAKLKGEGETEEKEPSKESSKEPKWTAWDMSSEGGYWGESWFKGQYSDVYEAVDDFLHNAASGKDTQSVPMGIHSPMLGKTFVVMAVCDFDKARPFHKHVGGSAFFRVHGVAAYGDVYTEICAKFYLDVDSPDVKKWEHFLNELHYGMDARTKVIFPMPDGQWLHAVGFLREHRAEVEGKKSVVHLAFTVNDWRTRDRVVIESEPKQLPAKPKALESRSRRKILPR